MAHIFCVHGIGGNVGNIVIGFKGAKSLSDWCRFFNQIKLPQENDCVTIDLNKVEFLNPQEILYLFLACQKIFKETNQLVVLSNINNKVYSYLKRVDFFNYGSARADKTSISFGDLLRNRNSKAVIEITKINHPLKISKTMIKTRSVLNNWYSNARYVDDIINILMEICGNSLEHSSDMEGQGECFFLLQKFRAGRCGVSIAVGDVGIGIKNHLMKVHPFSKQTDLYYIVQAMQGLTGRIDGDGGMGLQRVQGIVRKFQGKITVLSGNGTVCINEGNMKKWNRPFYFPGTQCIIELPFFIA